MAKAGITIETKDGRTLEQLFTELEKTQLLSVAQGLDEAMELLGTQATQTYMIPSAFNPGGGDISAVTDIVNKKRLTWRTGRLARSLTNNFSFSKSRLPSVKGLSVGKGATTIEKFSQGRKEGFRNIIWRATRNIIFAEMGTNVEYAAKHEFGSGTTPARPYLDPALKVVNRFLGKIMDKWAGKFLRKKGWQ